MAILDKQQQITENVKTVIRKDGEVKRLGFYILNIAGLILDTNETLISIYLNS